jgi:hypothetical protein
MYKISFVKGKDCQRLDYNCGSYCNLKQAKQLESQPTHPITVVSKTSSKSIDNTDAESRIDNDVRTTTDSIRRKPSNFLIPSMLVALLCFWPFGFAAIWQAMKVQVVRILTYNIHTERFALSHTIRLGAHSIRQDAHYQTRCALSDKVRTIACSHKTRCTLSDTVHTIRHAGYLYDNVRL